MTSVESVLARTRRGILTMTETALTLLAGLTLWPGATEWELRELRDRVSSGYPSGHEEFLRHSNGAEGPYGRTQYLVLWSSRDLIERNEGYAVQEFAPGLLLFGTDGGDTGYGFDIRSIPWAVVETPIIGMDWSKARTVAKSFTTFLQNLAIQ